MDDFLPPGQEMEIAETVEIMDMSEDFCPITEKETREATQSIIFVQGDEEEKEQKNMASNEGSYGVIELSEVVDCENFNYLQDTNILGKNLSEILNGESFSEKKLNEILNADDPKTDIDKQEASYEGETLKCTKDNRNLRQKRDFKNKENLLTINNNTIYNESLGENANENSSSYETLKNDNYTNKNYNKFNPEFAQTHLQEKCDLGDLLEAERRVLLQPIKILCHVDNDGDTPLMIIVSKKLNENSRFYEHLFAMQERLQSIRICCQVPMEDFREACSACGRTDPKHFYSPLSSKNKMGDSALTCAMKMEHSEMVIDYLLAGLSRNTNDLSRVFDSPGVQFCKEQVRYYPSLTEFIRLEERSRK